MTKMVATVAALQLVERGALDLDAPIEDYRPEWAELQVLDGFDGDTPRLRAPGQPGHGQAAGHAHHRAGLLVLRRGPQALGGGHRHPERAVRLAT